jgi:hypothetical protein
MYLWWTDQVWGRVGKSHRILSSASFWGIKQCSGNPVPTFRDNLSVPFSRAKSSSLLVLLDPLRWDRQVVPKRRHTITTRRCVLLGYYCPRRTQIWSTSRRKPEITHAGFWWGNQLVTWLFKNSWQKWEDNIQMHVSYVSLHLSRSIVGT